MNEIEKKLLEYLSANCRLTTTQIAKFLRIERHRVDYYYKKFVKNKTIINYELLLDYELLGYTEYFLYLKIFRYEKIKTKLIEFLQNNKQVRWAGEAITRYNVRITLIARTQDQVELFLQDLNKICEKNIIETEVLVERELIKKESYSTIELPRNIKNVEKITLKEQDKKLIKSLSENSQESLVNLTKKSEFSVESVRQKLLRFENQGFIKGFSAKYNMEKLGVTSWTTVLLKVNNMEKHVKKLRTVLYSNIEYGRTYKLFGKWNLEVTVFVNSYNQLFKMITKLEETFGEDIENFDLHITTKKLINTRIPSIVFE